MIIIDGDATPSINLIEQLAKKYNIDIIIYCDYNHNIVSDYSKIIKCDSNYQSVDIKIINDLKENDILITQDYGLSLLALTKKSVVINPNGTIINNDNIDILLNYRHLNQNLRKQKIKTPNIKKRTKLDDENLIKNLEQILKNMV